MYSASGYAKMVSDRVRMSAYAEALRRSVAMEAIVVDIGAGAGVFSLLACRFGARRVYAIEPDNIIRVAREIAGATGLRERIEFIQDVSTRVTLPEPADVVVADLRDILPWFGNNIPAMVDARRRFLRPGGILVPQCDRLWAAPVEAPEHYPRRPDAWCDAPEGFSMQPLWRLATNEWRKVRVKPEQLIAEPQCCATLDYFAVEDSDLSTQVAWRVGRAGTGHGVLVWFDTTLVEGVGFSNSPASAEALYGCAFFPWSESVPLHVGDAVKLQLTANRVGEEYVWRWSTDIMESGWEGVSRASFRQSDLYEAALSKAALRTSSAR